ncbi:sensor histidine kinase [Vitiosangium sp. GDMCC 1.1324]|uniref:sensor histidine kinase n=1 Tax=Vitiosangium sp. (strain GDMCC 1.1324) TaxID=2138576 RepID=UPI001E32564C|nr:sensor histidine kinase [Vitiosangium sp. GDMCC 1.1324]
MHSVRPWHRLQWRLTLAYAGATLGATVLIFFVLLMGLGYLLLHTDLPVIGMAEEAQKIASRLAPALESRPPDVATLEGQIAKEFARARSTDLPQGPLEVKLEVAGPRQGVARVVDSAGGEVLTLSVEPEGLVRSAALARTAEETVLLERALSGASEPERLASRGEDGDSCFAAPIRSQDGRVLGAVVVRLDAPFGMGDFAAAAVRVIASSGVMLALLSGLASLLFGAFITRRLVRRLQPMIDATGAWARGDFEAVARVPGGDELAALAEHLNQMAGELRTLVALRQELAASEERNRLARDLHDTVKQRLFATAMQLGAARTLLPRNLEKAEAHLAQASELVGGSQRDLMAILRQLRPSAQRESWTVQLSREVETWSRRTGISAETRLSEDALPAPVAEALTRIVQEGLANIARHSGASLARVSLERAGASRYTLEIEDNGRGLPATRSGGMGLDIMRERAEALPGGSFSLGSGERKGVRLQVTFKAQADGS